MLKKTLERGSAYSKVHYYEFIQWLVHREREGKGLSDYKLMAICTKTEAHTMFSCYIFQQEEMSLFLNS